MQLKTTMICNSMSIRYQIHIIPKFTLSTSISTLNSNLIFPTFYSKFTIVSVFTQAFSFWVFPPHLLITFFFYHSSLFFLYYPTASAKNLGTSLITLCVSYTVLSGASTLLVNRIGCPYKLYLVLTTSHNFLCYHSNSTIIIFQ